RESLRRLKRPDLPLRVDRTEEERVVPHDRAAAFDTRIVQLRVERLHRAVDRLVLCPRTLGFLRPRVAKYRTFDRIRPAFRHDVDDASGGLPELRLVAARLDLHF